MSKRPDERSRRADGGYPASRYWTLPDEVDGTWAGRRALAEALRDLALRCQTTEADPETLHAAAAALSAVGATLPLGRTSAQAFHDRSYFADPRVWVDRTALVGQCNPIAPPMRPVFDNGRTLCEVVLDERFVGAPGMVHGGVIASVYDQVFGHCIVMNERAGFTTELKVRYRRPTPVNVLLRFEAELTLIEPRRIEAKATCHRGDTLITEASGVFIEISPDAAEALIANAGSKDPLGSP